MMINLTSIDLINYIDKHFPHMLDGTAVIIDVTSDYQAKNGICALCNRLVGDDSLPYIFCIDETKTYYQESLRNSVRQFMWDTHQIISRAQALKDQSWSGGLLNADYISVAETSGWLHE